MSKLPVILKNSKSIEVNGSSKEKWDAIFSELGFVIMLINS